MPVLGQADFISTALASIKAQMSNYQLAVLDATPDGSVQEVLQNFRNIVHYSRHSPDSGQSAAIQEGWNQTGDDNSDIVAWLCADDYYFPYTFEEVTKVFTSRPEVDVVYGDSVFVDEGGEFLGYFPSISEDISSIVRGCCISQPACFVRRKAFKRVGKLNHDLHYIMDWDLWTRLFKVGANFYYLNKPLAAVRMYRGTKTSSRSKTRFREIHDHLIRYSGGLTVVRALVGFYYSALQANSTSRRDHILLALLAPLRWIKSRLCGLAASKILYGLETHTNRVSGTCHIYIPWYQTPSSSITVNCRSAGNIRATVNGIATQRIMAERGGKEVKHVFEIPTSQRASVGLFHITLENVEDRAWHLISVQVQ